MFGKILDWIERKVDRVIISLGESIKTFVQECWRLLFRIIVFFFSILLGFIHKPSFEVWLKEQRRGIRTPKYDEVEENETDFAVLLFDLLKEKEDKNVSVEKRSRSMSPTRSKTKKRIKKLRYEKLEVNRDRIFTNEKINTGVIEDFRLWCLLQIDRSTNTSRQFLHWIFSVLRSLSLKELIFLPINAPKKIVSLVSLSFGSYWKSLFSTIFVPIHLSVDKREAKDIVINQGYPYESVHIETDDGYILKLERLPRKESKKVIYFQHGVIDNSFAWFGHIEGESGSSLAFRAYDVGYDIFVGTFRGCEGSMRHVNPNITSKEYWNFSVNEHGFQDLPAFLRNIKKIKKQEFMELGKESEVEDIKITVIAHSMGAMATLMHLVWSGIQKKPHYMSSAILLSPAGYHKTAPSIVNWMGPLINIALRFFPFIHTLKFPGELTRTLVSKVMEDISGSFTGRKMLSYFVSKVVGGSEEDHTYFNMRNLTYNIFTGTSTGVYKHFWQIWRNQRFEAFDYGPEKNLEVYGTVYPTNILENFDKINIPVHFVMGLRDTLIEPVSVITQYATLKDFHDELSHLKAFPKIGHIDFTVGANESLINYILETTELMNGVSKEVIDNEIYNDRKEEIMEDEVISDNIEETTKRIIEDAAALNYEAEIH